MIQVAVTFAREELLEELNHEYCNLPHTGEEKI